VLGRDNELRVFASLADAKTLLNERVWRTEISAAVNESEYKVRRCERRGGTVLPVAGGRKGKETATPEPEAAAAPNGPKTAG
jgi:hypothetical protein